MATLNLKNIRQEIVNALRSKDVFTTTVRGVTTTSDSFNATSGQTQRTLTHTNVRNIRSLTVNGVAKAMFTDYRVGFNNGIVVFVNALTLNDAVVISYDYGNSDKIYPDFPRDDLTLTSFPRIGMEMTSLSTEPFQLGGDAHISSVMITIFVIVPVNKDPAVAGGIGGTDDLSTYVSEVRDVIRTYAKTFVTFKYITPRTINPITVGKNNKIMMQGADYEVMFLVE